MNKVVCHPDIHEVKGFHVIPNALGEKSCVYTRMGDGMATTRLYNVHLWADQQGERVAAIYAEDPAELIYGKWPASKLEGLKAAGEFTTVKDNGELTIRPDHIVCGLE